MKKKALSPLITTILLVVVAVILVTVVLAWSKGFSTKNLEEVNKVTDNPCNNAMISLSNCSVLNDTGDIGFYLKNISPKYEFKESDTFSVLAIDNENNTYLGDLFEEWNGLKENQTLFVRFKSEFDTTQSNISVKITVRSNECPQVFSTINNCHK